MKKLFLTSLFLLPIVLYAQSFDDLERGVLGYINQIIPIIILLIFVAVLWNGAVFIKNSGEKDVISEAKKRLWWSVIALFVTFTFWGIVQFFTQDIFGDTPNFGTPTINTDRVNDLFPNGVPDRNDAVNNPFRSQ